MVAEVDYFGVTDAIKVSSGDVVTYALSANANGNSTLIQGLAVGDYLANRFNVSNVSSASVTVYANAAYWDIANVKYSLDSGTKNNISYSTSTTTFTISLTGKSTLELFNNIFSNASGNRLVTGTIKFT